MGCMVWVLQLGGRPNVGRACCLWCIVTSPPTAGMGPATAPASMRASAEVCVTGSLIGGTYSGTALRVMCPAGPSGGDGGGLHVEHDRWLGRGHRRNACAVYMERARTFAVRERARRTEHRGFACPNPS